MNTSGEAERNIFGVIKDINDRECPCVHIKGHVSQHFIIGSMKFMYTNSREVSESEFIEACEKRGWECMIKNGSACIHGKNHQVVIAPNGNIYIDGVLRSITDQNREEREARAKAQNPENFVSPADFKIPRGRG